MAIIRFPITKTPNRVRMQVVRKIKEINKLRAFQETTIHGFVQRTSTTNINVMIVISEPVQNEQLLPIFAYAKYLLVSKHDITLERNNTTDELALELLNEKFKIIRNVPEPGVFSLYIDEVMDDDDFYTFATTVH